MQAPPDNRSDLLVPQVSESRYFFHNIREGGRGLILAYGGWEKCRPDYDLHRRSFRYHGLEYVAEGEGVLELAGIRQLIGPGSVFSYTPETRCSIRTNPRKPMLKYFVCLSGDAVEPRLRSAGVSGSRALRLSLHAEVRSVFEELIREAQLERPLTQRICDQLFELLLLRVEDAAGQDLAGDAALAMFQRCKAVIDAGVENLHTLGEVAGAVGIEEASVCRLFRKFLGTSPYQYLLRRKMNLAAELLMNRSGLVKEVAARVGFADPYHFSRAFKSVHGVAPKVLLARGKLPTNPVG